MIAGLRCLSQNQSTNFQPMIIKSPDDKRQQLDELQSLICYPAADANTKKRIEREILNIKAGIRGEDEAAYEMKVLYGESQGWMVLHDLRIEHMGIVAQIDHLIINRCLEIWVCESKHFSEGISINEHGEFTAFFGGKPYGVPSPIEQNNRHILVLKRLFDSNPAIFPKRLGFTIRPELKSLVLVSKRARIIRPKANIKDFDVVIKNDQLLRFINKSIDESNNLVLARVIGCDTLKTVAEEIAKLHKPIKFDWKAKFGLAGTPEAQALTAGTSPTYPRAANNPEESFAEETKPKKKLVCRSCGMSVPFNVARFCWFNKPKFGGNIFCMDCQKKIT
jgi:hypothetical protein